MTIAKPLFTAIFCLIAIFIFGQGLEDKVDEYLDPLVASGDFYGTVLFAKDGKIELVKGYGFANIEHSVKNTPQTIYHIASVNKPITAVGMMYLHQDGRIDIENPVSTYLPDYPNGNKINVEHLLSQTSGIPSYNRFTDYDEYVKKENTLEEVVDWFKNEDLLFEPGAQYGYSNSNFVLLAGRWRRGSQCRFGHLDAGTSCPQQ